MHTSAAYILTFGNCFLILVYACEFSRIGVFLQVNTRIISGFGVHIEVVVCTTYCVSTIFYNYRTYLTLLWWTLFLYVTSSDEVFAHQSLPWNSDRWWRSTCISGYIEQNEFQKSEKKQSAIFSWYPIQPLSNSAKVLSAMCGFALWRRNQHVQHILVLRFAGSAHGPHRHRRRCRGLHKAEEGEKAIGQGLQSQLLKGTTLVGKKSHSWDKQNHVSFKDFVSWIMRTNVCQASNQHLLKLAHQHCYVESKLRVSSSNIWSLEKIIQAQPRRSALALLCTDTPARRGKGPTPKASQRASPKSKQLLWIMLYSWKLRLNKHENGFHDDFCRIKVSSSSILYYWSYHGASSLLSWCLMTWWW